MVKYKAPKIKTPKPLKVKILNLKIPKNKFKMPKPLSFSRRFKLK